jgi:hypothetical protein
MSGTWPLVALPPVLAAAVPAPAPVPVTMPVTAVAATAIAPPNTPRLLKSRTAATLHRLASTTMTCTYVNDVHVSAGREHATETVGAEEVVPSGCRGYWLATWWGARSDA